MHIQKVYSYLMVLLVLLVTLVGCQPTTKVQAEFIKISENIYVGEPIELILEPSTGCLFDMHGQGNYLIGSSRLNKEIKFAVVDMETQQTQRMDSNVGLPSDPIVRYFIDTHRPDPSSTQTELWGYDSINDKKYQISVGKITSPAVSENIVVWDEIRDGQCNLYGYDFVNKQYFTVAQGPGCRGNPKISGDWVVYTQRSVDEQYRLELRAFHMSNTEDIFIGNMSTMEISHLPSNRSFDVDQNRVVWRTIENEIHIYNLENETEETIFQEESDDYIGSVDIAGDLVILNNGAQDKRGYDLLYDNTFEVPYLPDSVPENTGAWSVLLTQDYIAWLVNIENKLDMRLGTPLAPGEPTPQRIDPVAESEECNKKLFIAPIIRE